MVKWFGTVLWISYFFLPFFLAIYYIIVYFYGIDLNLTPVIPMGFFQYFNSSGISQVFVSAVGVFDFLTWGWLVKFTVSLVGLLLSLFLLPANILLAFIPIFVSWGNSFREACQNALKYVRFLLYGRQPIHQRWSTLIILYVWILAYIMLVIIFIYIMQVTVVVRTPLWELLALPPPLPSILLELGDPTSLLPFIPLSVVRILYNSGVGLYVPFVASELSMALVAIWIAYLFLWAIIGRRGVEENIEAFNEWLSSRRQFRGKNGKSGV